MPDKDGDLFTFEAVFCKNLFLQKSPFFFVLAGLLLSCSNDPLKVDITDVKVDIEFSRLDSIVFYSDQNNLSEFHKANIEANEPYRYLLGQCLQIKSPSEAIVLPAILEFRKDQYVKSLQAKLDERKSDFDKSKSEIEKGFRYLKFHLSEEKLPKKILEANTMFQSSVYCFEDEILIGKERYLGAKDSLIRILPGQFYFEWEKEGMEFEFLVRDVICGWAMTHLVHQKKENLAENLVFWGKVLYLVNAGMPNESPEVILRYSKEDFEWACENEYNLWKHLVDKELLFKTEDKLIQNMVAPGPFTVGLPEKGPDRLGQFLGFRMVSNYISENEISVQDLINTPYNKILKAYDIQ